MQYRQFCHFLSFFWNFVIFLNIVKSEIGTKSKNDAFSFVNSFDSIASAVNGINKQIESMFVTDSKGESTFQEEPVVHCNYSFNG